MKNRIISKTGLFALMVALVLVLAGAFLGWWLIGHVKMLAPAYDHHSGLMDDVGTVFFYAMLCGTMIMAGIGILILMVLHMLRRTARIEQEAEALRRKNEAIEALNQQTQKLAHHQRLETIGTLTSSIAHEFNNLLTPIMGYSLMALEQLPQEEGLYDDILEIYNASRKAKNIISRLSDLSRKNTSMTFRVASPDDLIRRTLDVARPARPSRVEVKLDLNCWDQRILANEIQLSQLLLNLILNAFQAMEASGGVLTLSTSYDEGGIRICVADTGCGIPQEVLPHIFEPFFTTKESGRGTGLGLAIAAQVVEDHQGLIRVESVQGQGTVFTVELPRTKEKE